MQFNSFQFNFQFSSVSQSLSQSKEKCDVNINTKNSTKRKFSTEKESPNICDIISVLIFVFCSTKMVKGENRETKSFVFVLLLSSLYCSVHLSVLSFLFFSFLFLISFLFLSFSPSALSLFLCSIPPITERYDVSHHFMSYRVITCYIALYCTELFTISSFSPPSLLSYSLLLLSSFSALLFSAPSLLLLCSPILSSFSALLLLLLLLLLYSRLSLDHLIYNAEEG